MRLIAWNANYNGNRRSLEANVALLEPLQPDVIVLSETARPRADNPLRAHWIGAAVPGLAVIVRDGIELIPLVTNTGAPPLMGGFSIRGRVSFNLLALWPVQLPGEASYHQVLMSALERYGKLLSSGRAILSGDLNSSTRVTTQRRTHPKFVAAAEAMGLVSAYHALTGECHGEERLATYFHAHNIARPFHIDYCFISQPILADAVFCVLPAEEWKPFSDHLPIVLDIADRALIPGPDKCDA